MSISQTTARRPTRVPVIFLGLAQRRGFTATTIRATPVWFGWLAATLKGLMSVGSPRAAAFSAWDNIRRVPTTRRVSMLRSGWRRVINFSLLLRFLRLGRRTWFGEDALRSIRQRRTTVWRAR